MVLIFLCSCEKETPPDGQFTDSRDGRVYETIKIASKTWMAENLAYLPSVNNPDEGSEVFPHYYVYDYLNTSVEEAKTTVNYQTHGVLYNWYAAKNACPEGWHLPSDEEWMALEEELGMGSSEAAGREMRNSGKVGEKLKSNGDWYSNGSRTNSSGFNAHPSGKRDPEIGESIFVMLGTYTFFWTDTPHGIPIAWYRGLGYNSDGVVRSDENYSYGFSIRCVQD